ncbi:MAG: EutN/CcmL family microcompartment protein [Planctomycetia bacterium]|nr:EutN/CcmL family microcompartment protein [Planctomycetia bacterium]
MKLVKIVGHVTLAKAHPAVEGASWKIAVPLREEDLAELDGVSLSEQVENADITSEEFVIYDSMGAAEGQFAGVGEGREAVNPFYPEYKPVDAYCVLFLDRVHLK